MIIESIHIRSFGMIVDMKLDFSEDVNVIVGHNEAGKSTIAAFIKYMLYGFGNDTVPGETDERTRRINWDNGTAQGSMTVRVGEKRYIITRVTERVENGNRTAYREDSSIIDADTGAAAFGKVPAGEVFFGVDRELFENTAFIGQIGDSSINEGSVKQSIENILFSGSERINNQRAAATVAQQAQTLLHKTGTGGIIVDLRRRSEQLKERLAAAEADNRDILAKEAELHAIRTRRKEQTELLDKLIDLDACYRNVVIIQSFDELHELEKKADEKNEEYNAFIAENTRKSFVPTEAYLAEIGETRRRVDDAYRALCEAEERYDAEKQAAGITKDAEATIEKCDTLGGESAIIARAKSVNKSRIIDLIAGGAAALAVLAVLVLEIVATGALAGTLPRVLFGILGAAALAALGVFLFRFLTARRTLTELERTFGTESLEDLVKKLSVVAEERARRDKLAQDTEEARENLAAAKTAYEEAREALLDVILRWGAEPPTSNLNRFLDDLEDKVRAFLVEEHRILEEKTALETAVRDLRTLLADKREVEIRSQVSPLKRKVLSEIDHDSIFEGIGDCRVRIAECEEQEEKLEGELAMLKIRAVDPGELYSKIQENEDKIARLVCQHAACERALAEIESASDNLRLEISPRLGEYTAQLIQVMTDKKYTDIDVSDGLKVSFVDESGEKKSVDFLSGGTRELTYVALRMALIDMLYTELPPVCFDESFAHQDNARARSMMLAISKLSEAGHQSFIFTCREREAQLAREICRGTEVFKLTSGDQDI